MRILMLTQWFDPEPAFKGVQFARELRALGHDVEVLTGFPNYPSGKLYSNYRLRPWQREVIDEISVVRVPLYPSHDRSVFRRAMNYLSFAISATLLGPWLVRRPDVIYAYHPPGTIALPALALKLWSSAPVVCDVQDLWPDTITSSGIVRHGPLMRLLGVLCGVAYRLMDRVVVLSPGFQRTLLARGVSGDRLSVIYNWARESAALTDSPGGSATFTVVYAGAMGPAQDLNVVLDAAMRVGHSITGVRFLFLGGGMDFEVLQQRAAEMQLENVEFRAWVSADRAQHILGSADALLVHLKPDPLFAITIPSKTQAYLAAGRPIIMAVRGDAADLVETAGAGILAEPGNPGSIANAVKTLAKMPKKDREQMGTRGREFYERNLSMKTGVAKFEAVFLSAWQQRVDARRLSARESW